MSFYCGDDDPWWTIPVICHKQWGKKNWSQTWMHPGPQFTITPFTQGLRPLCLPCATTKLARSPLKAQRVYLGRSRVAQRTFSHRHGRHGRREVLSMFKTVVHRSLMRLVTDRSLNAGRRREHASPWSQNGCTGVGQWSPRKIMRTVVKPPLHRAATFVSSFNDQKNV